MLTSLGVCEQLLIQAKILSFVSHFGQGLWNFDYLID
jgi:hypothetical protein